MSGPFAWVFNFDVEEELGDPSRTTPRAATLRLAEELAPKTGLLAAGDVIVERGRPARSCAGLEGRAWCPSPRALRLLASAGARAPSAPPLAVLQTVNHRRFCAELGQTLPNARFCGSFDEVEQTLALPSDTGAWLLKRPFGFVGRGRARAARGPLDAATRAFVTAALRAGDGLQVEPWVDRRADFAIHGYLDRTGACTPGEPTVQACDERGAWLRSRRADGEELSADERSALLEEADRVATALARAGYFGPFNVDAYRWSDRTGRLSLNPRSEINARYSMGWVVGMAGRRPDRASGEAA
jgi:hypothetical protein